MSEAFDAIIVGGGMAGAVLGRALTRQGLATAVVERGPPPGSEPAGGNGPERVSALNVRSRAILTDLGLWPEVAAAEPAAIRHIEVTDGHRGGRATLDGAEAGVDALGHVVPNRVLVDAAWRGLTASDGAAVYTRASVTATERSGEGVTVRLTDPDGERVLHGRLLVGADSEHSRVRQAAGIGTWGWSHNRYALVATVVSERPLAGWAFERFLPEGPLAFLPMGGHSASIVWTLDPSAAVELERLAPRRFLARLRERFGPALGQLTDVGPRAVYPLELRVAERFAGARTALVGNAAHLVHPVAGQGFNLGLRDVAALAEEVGQAAARGWDPGHQAVLTRYHRRRQPDTHRVVAYTEGLNRVFANDLPPLVAVRQAGLRVLDRAGPLKRAFMDQALGRSEGAPLPGPLRRMAG